MSEQHKSALYCNLLIKLPLSEHAITMSYMEILDEKYMDMNHVHYCYEICFCLENELTVKAGGCEYVLAPGEFLLVMPGTPHNVVGDPAIKKRYFLMVFDPPDLDEYDEKTRPLSTRLDRLSRSELVARGACPLNEVILLLGKMEKELSEKGTCWFFLFRDYCLEFILLCIRAVVGQIHDVPKGADNFNLASEIPRYIQNNLKEKIALSDIAAELHISTRHAQRIFKDYFGVSFAKALNLYRINHAKTLLVNTDLSINIIAERVGMSSPQPLYRLFREQEKISINEYRIKHRSNISNSHTAHTE